MTQERLHHSEMIKRYCPIIKQSCCGANCMSFKSDEITRKSKRPTNFGDWESIPLNERAGWCSNTNVFGETK